MTISEGNPQTSIQANPQDPAFPGQVADVALALTAPLYWHEPDPLRTRELRGATCFGLRFENLTIGVTAAHVIRELDSTRAVKPLILQVGDTLTSMVAIDICDELDIATFHWQAIARPIIDCRETGWPPLVPLEMQPLAIVGFPEEQRRLAGPRWAEFRAWGALTLVESVSSRRFIVTYDPARDRGFPVADVDKPPLGFNLSGCSGGPAFAVLHRDGTTGLVPVGLIIDGPKGESSGLFGGLDMITLARTDFIRADGSIRRPL